MSKNWFILNSENKLVNIIIADSKEIAEAITGLHAMETSPSVGAAIGDIWIPEHNNFKAEFPPHVGWIFDETLWRYEPPFPKPDDEQKYVWDDVTVSWIPTDSNS